jgi:hypothetical protein
MQDRRGLKANEPIGDKEYVGRRLVAKKGLAGAMDQARDRKPFDLRDFDEPRPPFELSLDWLGKTSVEPKVVRDLAGQAQYMFASRKPPQAFAGWVYLQAAKISRGHKDLPCPVVSSPEFPEDPGNPLHNPYHAIVRASEKFGHPYLIAQHLYLQFFAHGKVYSVPHFTLSQRAVAWLFGCWKRIQAAIKRLI